MIFHGTYGEDGSIQGIFEIMNIPYIGSNVFASSICMNKSFTKEICKTINIPVIEYYTIDSDSWFKNKEAHLNNIEGKFNYPVMVKPNDLGSSIGVGKAANRSELENALDVAATYSNNIIVEIFISAIQEVNCSVAEINNRTEISESEEPLISNSDLLSFDEKYLSSSTRTEGMAGAKRKIPASISEKQKTEIQKFGKLIFEYLDCSGVVRIDFIIDKNTDKVFLNEINTIPGSLAFYLWEAVDKNFTVLISDIIETSLKRFAKKNRVNKNFKSDILFNIDGSKLSSKLS